MTDNPRQNVTFPSNGSQAHGYLATPSSGSGPGVIVIQEWWGLTDHIAVAKRHPGVTRQNYAYVHANALQGFGQRAADIG